MRHGACSCRSPDPGSPHRRRARRLRRRRRHSSRTTTTTASPSTSEPAASSPTASAGGVPEAPIEPATVVPQSEWLTGTVEVHFPDGLAALGEHVFVKTDDGHVVRIDAASAEVDGDVRIDTSTSSAATARASAPTARPCGPALQASIRRTYSGSIPTASTSREKVPVDKLFDQVTLPVAGGKVWVLTGIGDLLTSIDTATTKTRTTKLGRRCLQLAATATSVYATCSLTDELVAVDATTGKVTATADVPNPIYVSVVDDDVWVTGGGGLLRLSTDLEPNLLFPGLTSGPEGDLVATPDDVLGAPGGGLPVPHRPSRRDRRRAICDRPPSPAAAASWSPTTPCG